MTRYHHPDRMGSVTPHTSASQGSAASRQYDAFGNVAASSGSWVGPFGFAGNWGYQEDGDSGLRLLGHRYYDPSTGRFLTRDPIKDGRNWYTYCENNPLTGVDPEGMSRVVPLPVGVWDEINKSRPRPLPQKPQAGDTSSGEAGRGGKDDSVLKPKPDGYAVKLKLVYKLSETEAWKDYVAIKIEMIGDLKKATFKRGVLEFLFIRKFLAP